MFDGGRIFIAFALGLRGNFENFEESVCVVWLLHGNVFEEFVGFFHHCDKLKCLTKRTIGAMIWLATDWSLWIKRNAVIFKNDIFSFI